MVYIPFLTKPALVKFMLAKGNRAHMITLSILKTMEPPWDLRFRQNEANCRPPWYHLTGHTTCLVLFLDKNTATKWKGQKCQTTAIGTASDCLANMSYYDDFIAKGEHSLTLSGHCKQHIATLV